ncbi:MULTISPECIES: Crp/Fnr family transcriptional regulator [Gracilibacillus]|uniref:Crp/Fnr family transcriptional regulator n=1 Tax=Gracilibacillus TaxID=74385 RepID=UPI000826CBE1|nr:MULTISPECIES: cyclic nucleotide-binding domain-containing protein [Gracilibacillus]
MKYMQDTELLERKLKQYELEKIVNQTNGVPWSLQQYEANEKILLEGAKLETLLFLVEGRVKITSSVATGKSLLLRFAQPFSIIGDIELIRDIPVQSEVVAVGSCLMIGLPINYIQHHIMHHPPFLHMLLQHVSYKLQTCTTASRINLLATVENKFASYLLSTLTPEQGNNFGMELRTSNIKEIAEVLGTTYRHLNRVIHSLTEKDVIEKDNHLIRVRNWQELRRLSNGIRYQ